MPVLRGACIGLALVLLVGSTCQAVMSSTAPPGTGMIVAGCCPPVGCVGTKGRIATPADVSMSFGWIGTTLSKQFVKLGRSYKSGLDKIAATMSKRFESQNTKLRQILTGYGAANSKFRSNLNFGKRSKAFLGRNRTAFLTGKAANAEFTSTLNERVGDYSRSFRNRKDIAKRLNSVDNSSVSSQALFPADATLSRDKLKGLMSSLKTTINAFPATNATSLSGDKKGAYRALKKAKRVRIAAAKSALLEVASGYAPTIPAGSQVKELAEKAGNVTRIEDGHVSPVGFLQLLVRSRFASDEYRTGKTGIHTMTRAGVLRELASVQALRLAIERRQLQRANQMAMLQAVQTAGLTVDNSVNLMGLYRKVVRGK